VGDAGDRVSSESEYVRAFEPFTRRKPDSAARHLEVRPALAVHEDHVADELGHPVGMLGFGTNGTPAGKKSWPSTSNIRSWITTGVGGGKICALDRGIDHDVRAGQSGVDVEPRRAERVVVEPRRRGLLLVRIAVDRGVRDARITRVVRVTVRPAIAREPGVGSASRTAGNSPPCRCTTAGSGPRSARRTRRPAGVSARRTPRSGPPRRARGLPSAASGRSTACTRARGCRTSRRARSPSGSPWARRASRR
jgi:hypothetical protein